ncbi:MAG TPA: HD domain-containing phosphohydrolase [Candidatus Polarisedimenticolaceae bacterium]|nr:HD domain-containing phosphohydrolase [Candidatus Polarisedimenticolaceae bacterium]
MNPESVPFKRRGRIVFALLAVLVVIGLSPLALLAWKLIGINREALTTARQEYQLLLASSLAHELDTRAESLRSQLLRVAQALGAANGRASLRAEEANRVLAEVASDYMPYLRYTYFYAGELQTVSAGQLPRQLEPAFVAGLQHAAETLAKREPQQQAEEAIASDPLLLATDPPRAVLVISAPVLAAGSFRGVLSALVDLQAVWDVVARRDRSGHVTYAVDRSGRVFASSDPGRVEPGVDLGSTALVRRFLYAEGRTSETAPFVADDHGVQTRYLGSYEVTGEGWGIFVQAPERDIYLPVQRMIGSTAYWAAVALAVAMVAALVFARTLSNPIDKLAAASRAFATGDFQARVNVRSGNEIGELAHTFNRMAEEIEDQIRRLRRAAEENRELFLGTIRAMAQAIDAKDPYTRGHSGRVNRYSVAIARELGLDEELIRQIHVSSLLHDVGKIGIDDGVLKKPGKLTPQEFEIMKTHPVLGANIMSQIAQMKDVIPGLRWHHERWKGGGYPDNLSGEQIPLMARIIAVADTFDAMTTHRPYQRAMTHDEAVDRINRLMKGEAFEARIVEAFNRAYRKGSIRGGGEEAGTTAEARAAVPV